MSDTPQHGYIGIDGGFAVIRRGIDGIKHSTVAKFRGRLSSEIEEQAIELCRRLNAAPGMSPDDISKIVDWLDSGDAEKIKQAADYLRRYRESIP